MGDCDSGLRNSVHDELGRGGSTKLQPTSADWRPWRQRGRKERSAPASPPNRLLGPTRPNDMRTGVGACQDVRDGERVECVGRRSAGHRNARPRHGHDVADLGSGCGGGGGPGGGGGGQADPTRPARQRSQALAQGGPRR
jgi:hypothetical protein